MAHTKPTLDAIRRAYPGSPASDETIADPFYHLGALDELVLADGMPRHKVSLEVIAAALREGAQATRRLSEITRVIDREVA